MKDIVLVGAGKIGSTIARLLSDTGDYRLAVVDRSPEQLRLVETSDRIKTAVMEITDAAFGSVLAGAYAVLSAAPYQLTTTIAQAAAHAGVHYLDLTEDVRSTREIRAIAAGARSAFLPQCGLAPGFVSIVAYDLASRFETLDSVRMRVGALPQYPSNALNYNLTWSTDGV
ncbi:MAG: saccharopine dehydrogenase NADP-binding domain-containing protein, partial [Parvibaculaceae bacterium]